MSDHLTDAQLDVIGSIPHMSDDVPRLVAEIRRLRSLFSEEDADTLGDWIGEKWANALFVERDADADDVARVMGIPQMADLCARIRSVTTGDTPKGEADE